MKKIFFFDRDGTLIKDVPYLNDVNKVDYFSDTIPTLRSLRDLGFEFIIVTNQSGLARGLISFDQMSAIHQKIRRDFSLQGIELLDILYAPYLPSANHPWRKPGPGMVLEALRRYNINKENSYMVGDSECDIGVGAVNGLKTFFLKGKKTEIRPTFNIKSLAEILPLLP